VKVLSRQAHILREEERCLEQLTAEHLDRLVTEKPAGTCSFPKNDFTALPLALQRRVLRAMIRRVTGKAQSPAFGAVEAIRRHVCNGRSGPRLKIAGAMVWRDYDRVVCRASADTASDLGTPDPRPRSKAIHLQAGKETIVPWEPTGQVVRLTLVEGVSSSTELAGNRSRRRAVLNGDGLAGTLALRVWRPGDWFRPAGMGGRRKKLQDYFSDIKLPRSERHRIPLLVAGDEILLVAGYRPDHRTQATSASKRLLIVEIEEASHMGSMN